MFPVNLRSLSSHRLPCMAGGTEKEVEYRSSRSPAAAGRPSFQRAALASRRQDSKPMTAKLVVFTVSCPDRIGKGFLEVHLRASQELAR